MLPAKDQLNVCFAHAAYRMAERFALRATGIAHVEVRTAAELSKRLPEADVLVVSMLWTDGLLAVAPRLKFIQSISSGTDQFGKAALRERGIRLASAAGVNARAVAEHAMALALALARRLPQARDHQHAKHWRGMISEIAAREDELGGKTMLVVGAGRIGAHLARLAKAFDMRVVAVRRDASKAVVGADEVHDVRQLPALLGRADVVVLCCPLTPETERLVDAAALASMKPTAHLVNVARGRIVDEASLAHALRERRIAGAALDVTVEEPLPESSPLWAMPQVLITPHTAGETRRYEDAVIDILLENLDRLWRGGAELKNAIV